MLKILFSGSAAEWDSYHPILEPAFLEQGLKTSLHMAYENKGDHYIQSEFDYIIASPAGFISDFTPYKNVKAVFSLWAGVEGLVTNQSLHQPLARMVDEGLTQGMTEWVCAHVLRHHLGLDRHIHNPKNLWESWVPPLASDRHISILGLGTLGSACGIALSRLGFKVSGWSQHPKKIEGIRCLHGDAQLKQALSTADLAVLLLPATPKTHQIINAKTLSYLPRGATLLNPGRGTLIEDQALLSALDAGHISHATLDVFHQEPLPKAHQFWSHPHVTVTPHCASHTRPLSAARTIAKNLKGVETGAALQFEVTRVLGY